jgi:transcriptional regulator GlxA family with amidase domain
MNVRVLVFDGADELDFVGPYEIFRRAAKLRKEIDVKIVSLATNAQVTAAFGLTVTPDGVLSEDTDLLVIPGGGWVESERVGVRAEIAHGILTRKLAEMHARGTVIAGVCTGTMALAAAGLLDGRPAVTHKGALADLRGMRANVVEARVVDAGDVVTCGGVTASIDLALWLVERFWGYDLAAHIADSLEYARHKASVS